MKNILCIGGSGQLGSKVVGVLSGYNVVNIDFNQHSQAKTNILLQKHNSIIQNNKNAIEAVSKLNTRFHAVLVTAGGWTPGSIKDSDYQVKVNHMNQVNLYPSLLAAHLAYRFIQPQGLALFTGAASVFKDPLPDMIAYALAKTAVHSLAMNLAEKSEQFGGRVITILPETIDTPSNREGMPNSDFSKWSDPQKIGELVKGWIDGLNVPANGSFVVLGVKNGCIKLQFV